MLLSSPFFLACDESGSGPAPILPENGDFFTPKTTGCLRQQFCSVPIVTTKLEPQLFLTLGGTPFTLSSLNACRRRSPRKNQRGCQPCSEPTKAKASPGRPWPPERGSCSWAAPQATRWSARTRSRRRGSDHAPPRQLGRAGRRLRRCRLEARRHDRTGLAGATAVLRRALARQTTEGRQDARRRPGGLPVQDQLRDGDDPLTAQVVESNGRREQHHPDRDEREPGDRLELDCAPGGSDHSSASARFVAAFAIVAISVYDAVNAINPKYASYGNVTAKVSKGTSADAAAAAAAETALAGLFPHSRACSTRN